MKPAGELSLTADKGLSMYIYSVCELGLYL